MEEYIDAFDDPKVVEQGLGRYKDQWSADAHAWFRAEKPRAFTMELDASTEDAGAVNVELWYTRASDYGIVDLWLNGQKVAGWDGYNADAVIRDNLVFPAVVKEGANKVEVRVIGKNSQSRGFLAGIDCFRATPRP